MEALNTSTEIPCPHLGDDIPIRTTLTSFKDFGFMSMEVIDRDKQCEKHIHALLYSSSCSIDVNTQ